MILINDMGQKSTEHKLLEKIDSPQDLRKLNTEELKMLCQEIREYIVECCSQNPGHLGSSLGAVEIIVGLHHTFDTPKDKLIFDVGHQAYAHKILTGRREAFRKNRTKEGISGFPKISESEYDAFGVGHSSTSISAAVGFATAKEITGEDYNVVAIIGDGALTGGLAFEGLNNAGGGKTDMLIIINDNNISIDNNIGAMHNYLLQITTAPFYNKIKTKIWNIFGDGWFRTNLQRLVINIKSLLVRKTGGDLFEAMGFRYFGPIDGNDIKLVTETLERLKHIKGPKILHTITKKGKGYEPAENDPTIWHAPGKFDPQTGKRENKVYPASRYQDVFGATLIELAKMDQTIVGITPAMASGCGMTSFGQLFPERFFDVGIEEEHAVTFSAGLAAAGLKPFCNIYSSFSQRAYDQIIHDVALQKLPVIFCFDRSGLVGEDGATHNGCFDMAAYRSIPDMAIAAPKDETELKNMMYSAVIENDGPIIIRYPRGCGEGADWENAPFEKLEKGKSEKLCSGSKVAVIAAGPTVYRAMEVAEEIQSEEGWRPSIYNIRYIKPFDEEILEEICRAHEWIITIEDGCIKGGLYSEVAERTAGKIKIKGLGIPDRFIEQASQREQISECGIDKAGIKKAILGVE